MRNVVSPRLELGRIRSGPYASDYRDKLVGAFKLMGPCGIELAILAGASDLPDAEGWEHVSVSTARRNPNWREMDFVKDLFWSEDELVVQLHPAKKDWVNIHPYCLHLWRHEHIRMPPKALV